MFCSKCGQSIETGSEFCIGCGSRIKKADGERAARTPTFFKRLVRRKIGWLIFAAVVVFGAGLFFGLKFYKDYRDQAVFSGPEELLAVHADAGITTYDFKPIENSFVKSTRKVEIKHDPSSGRVIGFSSSLQVEPKKKTSGMMMTVEETIPKKLGASVEKMTFKPIYPYVKNSDPMIQWDFPDPNDPLIVWDFDEMPDKPEPEYDELAKEILRPKIKLLKWQEGLANFLNDYLEGWNNADVWAVRSHICPHMESPAANEIKNYPKLGSQPATTETIQGLFDTFIYEYNEEIWIREVKKEGNQARRRAVVPLTMTAKSTGETRKSEDYLTENEKKNGVTYNFQYEKDYGWCIVPSGTTMGSGTAEEYGPGTPEWLQKLEEILKQEKEQHERTGGIWQPEKSPGLPFDIHQTPEEGGPIKFRSPSGIEWEVE